MDVFLIAYINKNFGDDLFVDMICRRYPQHIFHVVGSEIMTDYLSRIPNLRVHSYNKVLRAANARLTTWFGTNYLMEHLAKKYEVCVCIGGSIFIQSHNWKTIAKERERLRRKTLKYFIVSANFGPYTDQEYLNLYEDWFGKLTDVCFRDSYSYRLLSKTNKVRYAPDAIFGYMTKEFIERKDARNTLIVSCIDYSWRGGKEQTDLYERNMARIITYYIKQDWRVVLLALCNQEGDNDAANRICKAVENNEVHTPEVHSYDGDYKKVCELLKKADFVISSRFHATVIPLSLEIPVLPVPYSNKTKNMLSDIGYDGPIWELDNGDISLEEVENSRNHHFKIKDTVVAAQKQFDAVDKLLSSKK